MKKVSVGLILQKGYLYHCTEFFLILGFLILGFQYNYFDKLSLDIVFGDYSLAIKRDAVLLKDKTQRNKFNFEILTVRSVQYFELKFLKILFDSQKSVKHLKAYFCRKKDLEYHQE